MFSLHQEIIAWTPHFLEKKYIRLSLFCSNFEMIHLTIISLELDFKNIRTFILFLLNQMPI